MYIASQSQRFYFLTAPVVSNLILNLMTMNGKPLDVSVGDRKWETAGVTIQVRRTAQRPVREDMVPYSVDVVCIDQAGIVSGLSGFFSARGIDIGELSTRSYAAAHTGAQMFSVYMVINVPTRIHVGALREEFMDFCDQMNLDAILEPVKN
jgi:glycine cleavage system transcriptional repressor